MASQDMDILNLTNLKANINIFKVVQMNKEW